MDKRQTRRAQESSSGDRAIVPWTVILAAGKGRRLASVTGGVPKQFWCSEGCGSLLRQTLDRFGPVSPAEKTVVVVDASHRDYVQAGDVEGFATILYQPCDRGTATGMLLGLLPLLEGSPDDVVVVTPSDHAVADEEAFRRSIREAVDEVHQRDAMVVFGIEASAPEADFGWISPVEGYSGRGFRPVAAFVEKPTREQARYLLASGAVWNSMVVVARAGTIFDLFLRTLPETAGTFVQMVRRHPRDWQVHLSEVYPSLSIADFSRDILTGMPGLLVSVWPASLGWSDLGTPDRLRAWQERSPPTRPRSSVTVPHTTTAA
jgi:mannose-1-phosphate guanylyltransferase